MMASARLTCPIQDLDFLQSLTAGTPVMLSGRLITGRDAAHARLHQMIQDGQPLPVDLSNQVLYYVGPAPARPGQVVGSAGPTTASRMDAYTPELLALGLKATIGKGYRNDTVKAAMKTHRAVYFGAIGGLGALLSRCIRSKKVLAFGDLGPEAIYEFKIEDFPVIVLVDTQGRDFYLENQGLYRGY